MAMADHTIPLFHGGHTDDADDDDDGDGGCIGVENGLYILLAEQFWWLGQFGKCSRCSFVASIFC